MKVTGPAWPSTAALAQALADVKSDKVIHWGSGGKNGLQQLQAFKAAGVACPVFTTSLQEAKEWARGGARVFGRRLHHTQGNDIVGAGYKAPQGGRSMPERKIWITTKRGNRVQRIVPGVATRGTPEKFNPDWTRRDFWVKVIDSVNEYRQHIWDGRAIRIGKKVEAGEHRRIQPVRSRNNGWHIDYGFKPTSDAFTESIRGLAKAAVAALGYAGGAVDILEGRDGKLYVLEVNSAPALTDANTLGAYVEAIKKQLKREAKGDKLDRQ